MSRKPTRKEIADAERVVTPAVGGVTEVQIETRDWTILGEEIIDDPTEYRLAVFVPHGALPEIIAAWAEANGFRPSSTASPVTRRPLPLMSELRDPTEETPDA